MLSSSEMARINEIQNIYNSWAWLLKEDIRLKRWKAYEYRLEVMRKEMVKFGGKKLTEKFMQEHVLEEATA